eukprot:1132527-Alexandrium_andersonii.AAC.1
MSGEDWRSGAQDGAHYWNLFTDQFVEWFLRSEYLRSHSSQCLISELSYDYSSASGLSTAPVLDSPPQEGARCCAR